MKILHTSDWHIGRKLYNKEFEEEHFLFFEWLIETINNYKIDILIIAGDIFDVAYPSNTSFKMYFQVLTKIQSTCCKYIFITGGNHDSITTLNAPKNILEFLNINVIGGATENIEDMIFEIKNHENETEIVICAVPFLRDKDIRKSVAGEEYEDRKKAISQGIADIYNKIAEKVSNFAEKNIPLIATGHLFVNDADMNSEERELYIGGLQQLSFSKFPQIFDYIALGHIHRPQKIGKSEFIRYSGSPIALSFSEINQQKSVVVIETSKNKKTETLTVNIPKFRNILRFRGTLEEIKFQINNYSDNSILKPWVELIIEEKFETSLNLKTENFIQTVKNIEIINYKISSDSNIDFAGLDENLKSLDEMSELEIFDNLLTKMNITDKESLKNTFNELLSQIE